MDDSLKIRVETEVDDVRVLKDALNDLKKDIKILDYDFRQGKISADELNKGLDVVRQKAVALTTDQRKLIDVNAQLFQVQQRASVGFKSLAVDMSDLKNILKGLTTEFLQGKINAQQYADAVGQATQQTRQIGFVVDSAVPKIQNFRTTIGEARQENRMQNFVLREASQGLTGLTTAFGGATGATKTFTDTASQSLNTFSGLSFASQGLGVALGATSKAFGLVGVAVSALVALAGGIAYFFKTSTEESKKSAEAIDTYTDKISDLTFALSEKMKGDFLRRQRAIDNEVAEARLSEEAARRANESQEEILKATSEYLAAKVKQKAFEKEFSDFLDATHKKKEKILQDEIKLQEESNEQIKLGVQIQDVLFKTRQQTQKEYVDNLVVLRDSTTEASVRIDIEEKIFDLAKKTADEKEKQRKVDVDILALQYDLGKISQEDYITQLNLSKELTTDVKERLDLEIKIKNVKDGGDGRELKEAKKYVKEFQKEVDLTTIGTDALGKSIHTGLNTYLADSVREIEEAHSVFQMFIKDAISGLSQYIIKLGEVKIASFFLNMISGGLGTAFEKTQGFASGGMITEPIIGRGLRTATSYTFGERGNEMVTPMNRMATSYTFGERGNEMVTPMNRMASLAGGGGGTQTVYVTGEFRQRGRDLIATVKQANIHDRKKGGTF